MGRVGYGGTIGWKSAVFLSLNYIGCNALYYFSGEFVRNTEITLSSLRLFDFINMSPSDFQLGK